MTSTKNNYGIRKKLAFWLFLSFLNPHQINAQSINLDVTIHSRVDTGKKDIKAIAMLWINYLKSKPDSSYDNPYWNSYEKSKYKCFDFSVDYMYQFPSAQLLQYYKPTILSIEKEGDNYAIRTLFAADGLTDEYRKSNPWCITKLYAVKENDTWKLKNALSIITEQWHRKTVGKITFIYPPQLQLDEQQAKKAGMFCDEVIKAYQFPDVKPFDFYITSSGDEMGRLLNFDYYYAGYTTGIGMKKNDFILSGMGSPYYPHELIHMILPEQNRHRMIEEGFATWKGGQNGKTFEESAAYFADALAKQDSVTFNDVLYNRWGWLCGAYYSTGAILFQAANNKGGSYLVKRLLQIPKNDEQLIENICKIFEMQKEEFDKFWRREVLKYQIR